MKNLKTSVQLILPLLFLSVAVNAQKLPTKQQNSVKAPANIKIDGKLIEWDNKFQAYNSGSRVYYTISNDSKNLYLTLKMESEFGTSKALQGGITFTIIPPSSKIKQVEVTYHASRMANADELSFIPPKYGQLAKDPISNKNKMDSMVLAANNLIEKNFKQVLVNGIQGVTDPLIPIYNDQGIVVAARLNEKMEYVYELALPMSLISSHIPSTGLIKYNLQINAHAKVKTPGQFAPPTLTPNGAPNLNLMYRNNPTDFSGEYKLAK